MFFVVNRDNDANQEQSSQKPTSKNSSGNTSGPDDDQIEVIGEEKTTEDKPMANQTSDFSHKTFESAKYFGNLIFSAANRAGQTVTATAKQIKQTVEHVGLTQDNFTKEQQEFIKDHGGRTDLCEPPWVGCNDEDKVKAEILTLSQDKRHFLRSPPSDVQFAFDMDSSYPTALVLIREDPNLYKMRSEIVPKLVEEETFWRNYFYRVFVIKQTKLSSFDNKKGTKASISSSRSSSAEGPDDPDDDQIEVIGEEKTTEDKPMANQTSDFSHKTFESAKYFGNLIFSAANRAGQTVTATAKQIKQSVEHVGIMQDFTKEQQEFIKEHGGKIDMSEPPWVGCEDEDKVKAEILTLSQDKRNFVRSPPSGVQFAFDMDSSYPTALALLKDDPNLNKMRFEIVPKLVKEETFWRNYFYRVSLIKQATQLSSFDKKGANASWSSSRSSSAEGPDEPGDDQSPTGAEPEFVSDAYQGSVSAEEVRKGMRQLGVRKDSNKATDDLEEELSKDLQEFEVVAGDAVNIDEEELERELAEMDIK